jgi:hypothetical protein
VSLLETLVEPLTRGDPESPLRWTCKSTRKLADELSRRGHGIGYRTVAWLLHEAGYSLQANRKTREGHQHPDRNAQFEYINAEAVRFQKPIEVSDEQMAKLKLVPAQFHGDWNYTIKPRRQS